MTTYFFELSVFLAMVLDGSGHQESTVGPLRGRLSYTFAARKIIRYTKPSALLNFFPRNPPAYFLMIPLLNAREQVYSQTTVQTMYSIPYRIILPAWKYRYPTICIPVSIPYGRAIIILNPLPTSLIERLDNLKSYYNYNYSYIPW